MITRYKTARARRQMRTRRSLRMNSDRTRLTVSRSLKHIYAQIIDDQKSQTIVSAHAKEIKSHPKTKLESARLVGELLAEKALKAKITQVAFDKGSYKYHGRVKAVAEGARSKGLQF